jgi:hypothetical protein
MLKLSEFQDSLHMKVTPAISVKSPPQGHSAAGKIMSVKNPSNPIDPATFRLVALCVKQLRHRVPHEECIQKNITVVFRNDT